MRGIAGLASLRAAAREMVRVLGKFPRVRELVEDKDLEKYDVAIRQIFDGCQTLLSIRFKSDPSHQQ
jgi:hypothetical protein